MRKILVVPGFLALLIGMAPALAHAQFQVPSNEELKMTEDPKAPGAAAVCLYREENVDDATHAHSYYERVKVLAAKGKELATIRIPYERTAFKVASIAGRTIHADGTILPLVANPADLMAGEGAKAKVLVFTLPDVEVGSVFEYRIKLRYDESQVSAPTWNVQQAALVHKAHYTFMPTMPESKSWVPSKLTSASGGRFSTTTAMTRAQWYGLKNDRGENLDQLVYATTAVPREKVVHNDRGEYLLDLTEIPALPQEAWMPPLETLRWRVQFYYTYAQSGAEYWESEQKIWAKEADRATSPTALLKTAVEQIVSPTDSEEQKARKIYAAVMKVKNLDFVQPQASAAASVDKAISSPESVWTKQEGSADGISQLYVALARAVGLKAWPMLVADRDRGNFDVRWMNTDQLNSSIAVVEIDGKNLFLDPGEKLCPFGSLHWKHAGASGFRLAERGAVLDTTPTGTYKDAVVQRVGDLTIDAAGNVSGSVRVSMSGPDALRWRQLALVQGVGACRRQFTAYLRDTLMPGVQGDLDHFLALDKSEGSLVAIVNLSGALGVVKEKQITLPEPFFNPAQHSMMESETRATPIDFHYAQMEQDEITYHLPAGYTVPSVPPPAEVNWLSHAMLRSNAAVKEDTVKLARTLARNFSTLDTREYGDLLGFYKQVQAADQQQLVLTTAAGN